MLITFAGRSCVPPALSSPCSACVRKKGDLTLMSITLSQPASGNPSKGSPQAAPALLTRMSRRSSRASSSLASARQPSKVDGKADDLAGVARLEIGDGFFDLLRLARRDIDTRGARGEIALDDHLADAARSAGDECDAAVEAEHVLEVHGVILSKPLPFRGGGGGAGGPPPPAA